MASRSRLFSKIAKDVGSDGNLSAAALSPDVSFGATVYDSTGLLPYVGNDTGDQAYVKSTNRFYIWDSAGWYNVALINKAPNIASVLDSDGGTSPFALATDGTATTITITATDSDGDLITYSATTDGNFSGLATLSQDGNTFTITPLSQDSATTQSSLVTFKATDGVNISSALSTFTLTFISPLWDETVLSIGTSSTNSLANSTFIDRSSNAHTITLDGTPVQTAFHPYLDNWSVEFDGVDDYLRVTDNNSLDVGTGDFTIECWFYLNADDGGWNILSHAATGGMFLGQYGTGFVWRTYGVADLITATSNPTIRKWYHVAVSRSNGSTRMFIDGVQTGSTVSDTADYSVSADFFIGHDGAASQQHFNGKISNFRLVKGSGLYTSDFAPLTQKLTAVSGTSLLTCQSNRFIDNSSNENIITPSGAPKISSFNPFGQGFEYASGENKGSIASLNQNQEAIYTTSVDTSSDFTLECWVYMNSPSFGTLNQILYLGGGYLDNKGIGFRYRSSALQITSENLVKASVTPFPFNEWVHVAVSISPGVSGTAYVNGEYLGPLGAVSFNSTSPLTVLSTVTGVTWNNDFPMNGYVSDVAITSGLKYTTTSAFTPPTSPVGNTNAQLYLPMDNAGIYDKTGNNTLTVIGDTATSTTQTKYAATSIAFDGTDDYILAGNNELYDKDFTIELWWYPTSTARQAIMHGSWGNDYSIGIDYSSTSSNQKIGIWASSNGTSWNLINSDGGGNGIGSEIINQNAWNHIAYTRQGTTWRLFVNGVLDVELTGISGSIARPTQQVVIGTWWSSAALGEISGYVEGFQILKGVAKYTTNFTPPTSTQGRTYQAES